MRGEVGLAVGGDFTNMLTQIYRFHIFNCEDGGYGCFFSAKTIDVPGSAKLQVKNGMTLILEFFSQKKNKTS